MASNRLHRVLKKFVDLRPEEARPTMLLFLYFFLITSTASIIKPTKISLFLHSNSSDKLPYAYLVTAVLIGFVVSLNVRLLQRMKRLRYVAASVLIFAVSFILFWVLFKLKWPWVFLFYWFWSDLFIVTSVFQFWVLVNDIFHPRQVKRLIGFFVSGGLLGGILGALLASRLAKLLGTENLLLACPLFLAGCLVILGKLQPTLAEAITGAAKTPEESAEKVGYAESFRIVRKHRYLLFLSGIMVTAIVVTTLLDYQFNAIVEKAFPGMDLRTSFLGTFFVGLFVFSYLLNAFLSSRAVRSFGLQIALLITPAILLLGSVAIFLVPAGGLIYWAVAAKGLDKSLAHTLNQSVRELLYIPVPPEIKYKAKVFIDMFVNKLGDAVAAVLLLLFVTLGHMAVRDISLITACFIAAWILFCLLITREYVHIVKRHLKLKWQDAGRLVTDAIDVDMTKLVFDTLESKKRSSVLYAMNLFDLIRKEKLSPELRSIIASKSSQIQASSLDSLLGVDGEALFPEVDDSLTEENLDAEVQEIMSLDVYQEMMAGHLLKVTAATRTGAEVERMEAAKALGLMSPDSDLVRNLRPLLRDESTEVASYALESAAKLKKREFVPLVLSRLALPSLQQAAAKTLVAYGERIVGTLKDYLGDPTGDVRLRRAIPDVLALIGTPRAAELLTSTLTETGDLESEVIAAAAKLRTQNPELEFSEGVLQRAILRLTRRGYGLLLESDRDNVGAARGPSMSEMEAGLARTVRDIFSLLGLLHPQEDIRKAFQNLSVGTKKNVDYALELLDAMLKRDIKTFLLPLIDDAPHEERVRRCRRLLPALDKLIR